MKTTGLINLINNKGFIDLNLASFNKIEKIHFASNATHYFYLDDGNIIFKHYFDIEHGPKAMGAKLLLINKFDLNNFNYIFIKIEEKYNIYFFLKITFV